VVEDCNKIKNISVAIAVAYTNIVVIQCNRMHPSKIKNHPPTSLPVITFAILKGNEELKIYSVELLQ
jgi:hypothetical protein